jgi:membrane protein DedA with SNARE-associated domain
MFSFRHIEYVIKSYASILPLDLFSLAGSFLEEIIPPIPSPLIMTTAGSLAFSQHYTWIFLLWLAIIGSIGKTLASWIFYVAGDKSEDIIVGRWGKYVGIRHEDVELLGKKFNGGWRDEALLFIMRATPIFPSVSVSVVAGIIRLNMKTFIGATFLGTIVKNLIYLYAGYGGVRAWGYIMRQIHSVQFWVGLAFSLVALYTVYWFAHKRHVNKKSQLFTATSKKN